jgi:cytochrome c biogenesis protein
VSSDVQDTAAQTSATATAEAVQGMSTVPLEDTRAVLGLGLVGWLRWTWRQLTSMRTALTLLLLLALAAIPGSIFPQRTQKPIEVNQYLLANPYWGKVLDGIGIFDVFSSPWFAAIYVLLFVSLTGCVLPRAWSHVKILRQPPPNAPRRLSRLPESRSGLTDEDPQAVLDAARSMLKRSRWRVREQAYDGTTGWVAAEKGYARETGNLIFHLSLLGILVAVALGSLTGFSGKVILVPGKPFADSVSYYDSFTAGRLAKGDLPPFLLSLDDFNATYQQGGTQSGAPRSFSAVVTSRATPDAQPVTTTVGVNQPLEIDGVKMFLVGHGYAPEFTVKDKAGNVVFKDSVVFLPQDGNFTSTGVVKVPFTTPQLGLQGFLLPTYSTGPNGPYSSFPALNNPTVFFAAYLGDLDKTGVSQSVYTLDTTNMKQVPQAKAMAVGDSWTIPGSGQVVTFTGVQEFASFSVANDPGKGIALAAAMLAVLGLALSLLVRRRRLWVRVTGGGDGVTVVEVAGLTRSEHASVTAEVDAVLDALPLRPAEAQPATAGSTSTA